MNYLLDTNACIHYLKYPESTVARQVEALHPSDLAVSSVTKAELFYGAMRSNNPERSLRLQEEFVETLISLPFDDAAARVYAKIRAELAGRGTPIGPYDL